MLHIDIALALVSLFWVWASLWILKAAHTQQEWRAIRVAMLALVFSAVIHAIEFCALAAHDIVGGRLRSVPASTIEFARVVGMVALCAVFALKLWRRRGGRTEAIA